MPEAVRAQGVDVLQVRDPGRRTRSRVGDGSGPTAASAPTRRTVTTGKSAMEWLAPILGVVLPVMIGGAFWLGRTLPRVAGHGRSFPP